MLVIGAGPAGLKAASELARAGFRTKIVKKQAAKTAEWTVPPETLKLLPVKDVVLESYPEGMIKHFSGTELPVKGRFLLLDSTRVYKSLSDEAKSEGVQFIDKPEPSMKTVVATGASTRKFDKAFHCWGAWFDKALYDIPVIEMGIVGNGFFIYPWENRVFVCAWRTHPMKNPTEVLAKRMGERPGELIGGLVPVEIKEPEQDGTLFVGDALSAATPVMGEGLRPSLLSAKLAAESIAKNKDYAKLLKREFGFSYRFSAFVRDRIWHMPSEKIDRFMQGLRGCDPKVVYDLTKTTISRRDALALTLKLLPCFF